MIRLITIIGAVIVAEGFSPLYADGFSPHTVTNINIVSDSVESRAWTRQAVMVSPSDRVMDLSGAIVAAADAAVQSNEAERVAAVSDAAIEGMKSAFGALYAVTGNVPDVAYHVALAIAPIGSERSLTGFVVKEETDGVTDTQWVWYSHALAAPPVRHVEYTTPNGVFNQSVAWINWNADGETLVVDGRTWKGCHKCTIPRPVSARNLPALTRQNEIFGGLNGFDFGSAVVTVGGKPAFTGTVSNDVTGATLRFDNGILQKENDK
jgi:hypothetical protein